MSLKGLISIVLGIVVAIEIFLFVNYQPEARVITNTQRTIEEGSNSGTGFSRFKDDKVSTKEITELDYSDRSERRNTFMIIIAATIIVGGIIIYSSPNTKLAKKESD